MSAAADVSRLVLDMLLPSLYNIYENCKCFYLAIVSCPGHLKVKIKPISSDTQEAGREGGSERARERGVNHGVGA